MASFPGSREREKKPPPRLPGGTEGGRFPPLIQGALHLWAQSGEQHWIPIDGQSMLPSFCAGDRVRVAHGATGIRRGDAIVFFGQGRLIAHRVLRIKEGGSVFVTKGDAVPRLDPPVHVEEVVGRVVVVERDGRQWAVDSVWWRAAGWLRAARTLVRGRIRRKWRRLGWASARVEAQERESRIGSNDP